MIPRPVLAVIAGCMMLAVSQAQYDAIPTKDAKTIYYIV